MKTRLVSYVGGKIDLAFPIQEPRVTIGREADNFIQLPDDKISKHHAVILQTQNGWAIEDLHSTNGVLVNGRKVERATLQDGDIINIGPYEFHFEANAPSDDRAPSHVIDLSSHVHRRTLTKEPSAPD